MKGATILFIYIKSIESTSFKGIILHYVSSPFHQFLMFLIHFSLIVLCFKQKARGVFPRLFSATSSLLLGQINWLYILSKGQALDKVFIFGPAKPGFLFLSNTFDLILILKCLNIFLTLKVKRAFEALHIGSGLGQGFSFPIGLALPGPWTPQLVVSVVYSLLLSLMVKSF